MHILDSFPAKTWVTLNHSIAVLRSWHGTPRCQAHSQALLASWTSILNDFVILWRCPGLSLKGHSRAPKSSDRPQHHVFSARTFWISTHFVLAPLLRSPRVQRPLRPTAQQCTRAAPWTISWRHPRVKHSFPNCGIPQAMILCQACHTLDAWRKRKRWPLSNPWRKAWLRSQRTVRLWSSWRRWLMFPNRATQRQTLRLSWTSWAARTSRVLPGHLNAKVSWAPSW